MKIDYKKHSKTIASKLGQGALWGAKKTGRLALLGLRKTPATFVGFYNVTYNGALNLGNSIFGDSRIKKLEDKLNRQSITFNKEIQKHKSQYPYFDSYIVSGLSIPQMINSGIADPDLELAYQYQFPHKANQMSLTEAWQGFDSGEQLLGFNNALKGKLFEIKYLDHISETLEPGYTAKLADSPTQKGFDIEIYNPLGEIDQQLQLKASTSASYVKKALEQYPEIDVVTLEDFEGQILLANQSSRIIGSSISNDDLISSMEGSVLSGLEYLPLLGLSWIIFSEYTKKEASEFQKTVKTIERMIDYLVNAGIISVTGFFGIPIVAIKQMSLTNGEKKRLYIQQLKKKLSLQKKSHKRMKKMFSRRDFLKSLAISPVGLKSIKA
tara:strand:- start:237 stop:1382 length:1146 start_codon:yes stop_codon:yes gene_type:complete